MNARLPQPQTALQPLSETQSIGQLAVELPGATAVFRRLKLDFCCGGNLSLAEAAQARGLAPDAVLAELAALQRPDSAPAATEPGALIDHIIGCYHDVHRAQFPELIRMAHRVESVHRDKPGVPAGLGAFLETMQHELTRHMHKEEAILFPMLKAGGNPFVVHPIGMMRAEHTDHGAALDLLNALTNDANPPAGACNTWRALYAGVAQLREDLIEHIHLENNVLFPLFEAAAAAGAPVSASANPAAAVSTVAMPVAAAASASAAAKSGGCGGGGGGGCGCQ